MSPRFVPFSPAHLAVLAAVGAAAVALPWAVRHGRVGAGRARAGLALVIVALLAAYLVALAREGPVSVWDVLPLHLCDFLLLVTLFALATLDGTACELVYFWGGTGTLLATLTPDLAWGWPDWRFVVYFGLHGAVVVAAALVAFGLDRAPRAGAPWRVFALTNLYAAGVAVVDAVWGMNFLYLCGRPSVPTLLDWLGPWPAYLVAAEALALGSFFLLDLPWRGRPRLRGRRGAD